ncbi:HEAT repeat domain-containing protein [Tardisphaera miroshnichenkoae]
MDFSYLTGRDFVYPDYQPKFTRTFNFSVDKLKVSIRLDPQSKSIEGLAEYDLSSWDTIELDAVEMKVKSVELDGQKADFAYDGKKIIVSAPLGHHVLKIAYSTTPRKGLTFVEHEGKTYAWTQGESEDNRYWIPLPDSPHIKFPTQLSATVPSSMIAVSNGVLVNEVEKGNEKEWTWSLDKPHSPYLIDLAAGDFDVVKEQCGDLPLEYYVPKGWADKARMTFYRTCDAIKFFEDYTGVKYPWPNYKQIAVWGFGGGMENTTATLLTASTLHDEHAHCPASKFPCPDREDFTSDPLIVHELAHQWFGDMETAESWSEIWLNESFATLMETLYERHAHGQDEFEYSLHRCLSAYLSEYREKYARPIVFNVYDDPWELFDRHSYEKGCLVLWHLANLIGEEAFKKTLHEFLTQRSFKPASTTDLQRIAEEVSKKKLQWFFYQFVYSAGHPQISYSWDYDSSLKTLKILVDQVQPGDSYPAYDLNFDILIATEDGEKVIPFALDRSSTSVYVKLEKSPKFVCIDPSSKLFFERKARKKLEEAISQASYKTVTARLEAIDALKADGSNRAVEALSSVIQKDTFWGCRAEAAKALGEIGSDTAINALLSALSTEQHPRVRTAIAEALGKHGRNDEAAKALSSVLLNEKEGYYARGSAAAALGTAGGQSYEDELIQALNYKGHNYAITIGAIDGLSKIREQRALDAIIKLTSSDADEAVRSAATRALGAFPDETKATERLKELIKDRSLRVRRAAVEAMERSMNPRLIGTLEEASARDPEARIRRAARDALRKLKENTKGTPKEVQDELEKIKAQERQLDERISKLENLR